MKVKDTGAAPSQSALYAIYGMLIGIVNAALSYFLEMRHLGWAVSLKSILHLHTEHPVFWFIDGIPLILAGLAAVAGKRQDQIMALGDGLEQEVAERTYEIQRHIKFFKALVDSAPLAVVTLDNERRITSVNRSFGKLFGYSETEAIGQPLDLILGGKDLVPSQSNSGGLRLGSRVRKEIPHNQADGAPDRSTAELTQRIAEGRHIHSLGRRKRKDGRWIEVEEFAVPVMVAGLQIGMLMLYNDISRRVEAEAALHETIRREQRLTEITRIITQANDFPSILRKVVELACDLLNADAGAIGLIQPDDETLSFPYLYGLSPALSTPEKRGQGMGWHIIETGKGMLISDYGEHPPFQGYWKTAGVKSFIGAPIKAGSFNIGVIWLFRSEGGDEFGQHDLSLLEAIGLQAGIVIEKAQLFEHVFTLSITDELTGVYNRRYFDQQLAMEFRRAQRYKRQISLMIMDCDDFKQINDTSGHLAGDKILRRMAAILRQGTRESDTVARFGGDEFGVVMPETDGQGAAGAAEKIHQLFSEAQIQIGDHRQKLKVSIGVASYPANLLSAPEDLINLADRSLYEAKKQGGCRIVFIDPELKAQPLQPRP